MELPGINQLYQQITGQSILHLHDLYKSPIYTTFSTIFHV